MKYLFVGLAILAFLVFSCWSCSAAVTSGAERLIRLLEQAESACRRGDEAARRLQTEQAREKWQCSAELFHALLSHTCTDEIEDNLQELQQLDSEIFLIRCEALIRLLRRLQVMDLPRLGNIF